MKILEKYKANRFNSKRRVLIDNFPHPTYILQFMYMAHVLNTRHETDIYFVDEPDNYACSIYRELGYIPVNGIELNKKVKLRSLLHYNFDRLLFKFYKKDLLDIEIKNLRIADHSLSPQFFQFFQRRSQNSFLSHHTNLPGNHNPQHPTV